jgi:anti-sigma factor RsiW
MRHISEDELHAYLDQGLSRSQCVEIESHLAACPSCQAARDGIAAMRDRITALLAKLAPPRAFPPEFESLRGRAASEVSARRRRSHIAAWAASLVVAVGLGWTASFLLRPHRPVTPPAARQVVASPVTTPAPVAAAPARPHRRQQTARTQSARRRPAAKAVASGSATAVPSVIPPPPIELSSSDIPRADLGFELVGMWRTISWAGAQAEAGEQLPHIDGLPVVQVQVQASEQGKQPLMVVAQQLASGEVIRTIEGPTSDVSHLLARRAMSDPRPTLADSDRAAADSAPSGTDYADRTMAMQRGDDRMLVITGALPSDSLLAMIRRLNAEMRSR